jgi:mono/diheme cytochrome c family protein
MRVSFATLVLLVSTLILPAQTPPLPPSPPATPGSPVFPRSPATETIPPVATTPPANPVSAAAHGSALAWDALVKEVKAAPGAATAEFTFWVTNTSATDAAINSAHTSCGCTVAKLPSQPWILKPGESGPLNANMNLLGKHGLVTKTITLDTSAGPQILTVRSDIPNGTPANLPPVSGREQNQMAALADRQAIFRNDCAKCHVEPTLGRTGEKLFITACGICHTAEHRAAMVPDLSAIKTDTNADYWRTWVTFGKPGTLMAAFSKKHGGILDDSQIDSLVDYLVKTYPSKAAPAAKPAGN